MAEPDPEPSAFRAGQRLGAPETLGISTLDPAHRPPAMPPGRHVTVRVRMLDDTEELFDVSVSVRSGAGASGNANVRLFITADSKDSLPGFVIAAPSAVCLQVGMATA